MVQQITERQMKLARPDGSTEYVTHISSNRDHVDNLVAEGALDESGRLDRIIKLYEGQLAAKQRHIIELQSRLGYR